MSSGQARTGLCSFFTAHLAAPPSMAEWHLLDSQLMLGVGGGRREGEGKRGRKEKKKKKGRRKEGRKKGRERGKKEGKGEGRKERKKRGRMGREIGREGTEEGGREGERERKKQGSSRLIGNILPLGENTANYKKFLYHICYCFCNKK